SPSLHDLVAIRERLRKMMDGVEEQHRNIWLDLVQHVHEHHAFGLKGCGYARNLRAPELFGNHGRHITHVSNSSRRRRTVSTASASVGARRAANARRFAIAPAVADSCSRT